MSPLNAAEETNFEQGMFNACATEENLHVVGIFTLPFF